MSNSINRFDATCRSKKALNLYFKFRTGRLSDIAAFEQLTLSLFDAHESLVDFVESDKNSIASELANFEDAQTLAAASLLIFLTDLDQPFPSDDKLDFVRTVLSTASMSEVLEKGVSVLVPKLCDALSTSIQFALTTSALNVIQAIEQDDAVLAKATLIDCKTAIRVSCTYPYALLLQTLLRNFPKHLA